jgi:predicted Zn finger-like uncharacterized protein
MPLVPTPAALQRLTGYAQFAYARPQDGVTVQGGRDEIEALGRALADEYPRTNHGMAPVVQACDEWFVGARAKALYETVWAAAGSSYWSSAPTSRADGDRTGQGSSVRSGGSSIRWIQICPFRRWGRSRLADRHRPVDRLAEDCAGADDRYLDGRPGCRAGDDRRPSALGRARVRHAGDSRHASGSGDCLAEQIVDCIAGRRAATVNRIRRRHPSRMDRSPCFPESCGHSGHQSSPKPYCGGSMWNRDVPGDRQQPGASAAASPPQSCPSCTSTSITSTAKIPDANSYWRCSRCGEVWNAARRTTQPTQRWRG